MSCLVPQFKCRPVTFSIQFKISAISITTTPNCSHLHSFLPIAISTCSKVRDPHSLRTQCILSAASPPTSTGTATTFNVDRLKLPPFDTNTDSVSAERLRSYLSAVESSLASTLVTSEEATIAAAAAEAVALAKAAVRVANDAVLLANNINSSRTVTESQSARKSDALHFKWDQFMESERADIIGEPVGVNNRPVEGDALEQSTAESDDMDPPVSFFLRFPCRPISRCRLLRRRSRSEMFSVTPNNPLHLQKHFDSSSRRFIAISGAGFGVRKVRVSRCGSFSGGKGSAMEISSKDKTVEAASPSGRRGSIESTISSSSEGIEVRATMKIRKKMKEKFTEKIDDEWEYFINGIGRGILIRLVSEDIDPGTNSGRTIESSVRGWLPKPLNGVHALEYAANFTVPRDFGSPGAVLITNLHGKEFYLLEVIIHGFDAGPIFFPANTWIHSQKDNSDSRIIFKNHAYLPSKTPPGLQDLRRKDLTSIRGNGKGERKPYDRIYDYDVYNDLGNPDKSKDLARPVLGVEDRPYPRRCRTGRSPSVSDQLTESRIEKPHPVYVPRDETFEEIKQNTFAAGRLKALVHNLVPMIAATLSKSDISFKCFSEIDKLYIDGVVLNDENHQENSQKFFLGNIMKQVVNAGQTLLKYEIPAVIKSDRFSWLRDNEFARQTLAGVNPVNIECLKEFPIRSKLDPNVYGPPESAITKELIENELYNGMSVEQAIEEKRLFILDYHDMILPFVKKINALPGRKVYASRTVFFYSQTGILRPIAIELSLPPTPSSKTNKYIYTHGHDATTHWIWKLAKAHVCSVDAGIHQLVNHWLRTHASMEPYIIATHRQLSSMHPIYKLLHPHMRYTLEINALARQNLINGGGIIEASFLGGKYSMELSSAAYKSFWRFDLEALPEDLIRRGMAVEDPSMPNGVRLVIEDYPYAADGLLIWSAIKEWVESYVEHFYSDSNSITTDAELQAWWSEIKNKGHPEKRNEPWWPKLNTKEDLSGILTTMIWIASGQHAAINFGQYPFGSYVPNRPTLMRKLIPQEGDKDYESFIANPQRMFLSSLPTKLQATKVMAVQDTLSTHSADEEYLGQVNQLHSHWIEDRKVLECFNKFSSRLEEIEEIINSKNKDGGLKNRSGAGVPPYELLLPTSGPGVTGRGIPNSISI